MRTAGREIVLRASDGGERRATPLELFFDLVYVYATTQLSHLFVTGHGFFVWTISERIPWSRLAAVVAPVALAPLGFAVPALALAVAAALVVAALAKWDSATYLGRTPWRSIGL